MAQPDPSRIPLPREGMPDWLLPLRNAFLTSLLSLDLKPSTVRTYAPAVDWLCAEAGRKGLTGPDGIDESVLARGPGAAAGAALGSRPTDMDNSPGQVRRLSRRKGRGRRRGETPPSPAATMRCCSRWRGSACAARRSSPSGWTTWTGVGSRIIPS